MRPIDLHTTDHSRINGQGKVYCIDSIKNAPLYPSCISLLYVSGKPLM